MTDMKQAVDTREVLELQSGETYELLDERAAQQALLTSMAAVQIGSACGY